jgi:hypothetical protein
MDKTKEEIRADVLREVLAEAMKYGSSYFLGAPLEKFIRWLNIQLLDAERAVK